MSWHECPLMGVQWCECSFGYVMIWMFWCKHNLFKNSLFIFKMRLSQRLKPKHFQNLIYCSWKVLFFWLKAPKKLVITIRKSLNGAFTWNLMIWLKRLISTIWLRGWHVQGLFMEKWILWKSSILKRFIFLVSEYSNLTGIKTRLW